MSHVVAAFQVIYVLVLLHFATLCLVSGLAIYGSFKVGSNPLKVGSKPAVGSKPL